VSLTVVPSILTAIGAHQLLTVINAKMVTISTVDMKSVSHDVAMAISPASAKSATMVA
jgi:peroxiredoxin